MITQAYPPYWSPRAGIKLICLSGTVQTEGSAAASFSAAGSVRRRIVRAQRCSIKTLICSTTGLSEKLCSRSDWSMRAVAGSNLANSRMRRLACALVKPTPLTNCSQCRAWTSLKLYLLPIFIAILGVSVEFTAVDSESYNGAKTEALP